VVADKGASSIKAQVLAGILTVLSSALGLGQWLLARTFIRYVLLLLDVSPWAWRWWENVNMIALGLAWLVFVYLVAHYYQQAAREKRLWRLFAWVTLGQASLVLFALGLLGIGGLLRGA